MGFVTRHGPPSSPRGLPLEIVRISTDTTINANHAEAVIQSTAGSDITVTLPNNLPVGFTCLIEQGGAGQVIVAAASGATVVNRQDFDRTAGQYAVCSIFVRDNTNGVSAAYNFAGDGAVAA